jgi:predicted RNA-binding protein YlxR (DUF448 family)
MRAGTETAEHKTVCKTGHRFPERSCVACGASDAKGRLVRFVRGKDGSIACDASGRARGRGAYLCAREECFRAAEKRSRLSAALKCPLDSEDYQRLHGEFSAFLARLEQKA